MVSASQVSTPATRTTFQETPLLGTCLINVREGRKLKNIQGKAATITLNALQLLYGRIYVEKTSKQFYLGYHDLQKVREGV